MSNWTNENGRTSTKWKGKSTYQLREKLRQRAELAQALRVTQQALQTQLHAAEEAVREELYELIPQEDINDALVVDPADIALGGYDCPESPTGRCLYNHAEDPYHDSCIICGEPSERK